MGMGTSVLSVFRSSASTAALAPMVGYAVIVAVAAPPPLVFPTASLPRVPVGTPIWLDMACRATVPVRPVTVPLTNAHSDVDAMTTMATAPSFVVPVPLP